MYVTGILKTTFLTVTLRVKSVSAELWRRHKSSDFRIVSVQDSKDLGAELLVNRGADTSLCKEAAQSLARNMVLKSSD